MTVKYIRLSNYEFWLQKFSKRAVNLLWYLIVYSIIFFPHNKWHKLKFCDLCGEFVHAYTHAYMHTYIHTYIHACIHTHTHTHIHTHIHTYRHTYIPAHIHTYIQTYIHKQAYACVTYSDPSTQWAAVRARLLRTRTAPHEWLPNRCRDSCHGNSPSLASVPSMIWEPGGRFSTTGLAEATERMRRCEHGINIHGIKRSYRQVGERRCEHGSG